MEDSQEPTSSALGPADADSVWPCGQRAGTGTESVLLVDDEPTLLKLFCSMLESSMPNISIDCAENGAEAIEKFGQTRPGVMVMDLCMPVMDGQRTFFEIEKLCKTKHWSMPAVVFCSAFSPPSAVRKRIADNPRHCMLHKPIFSSELVEAVRDRLHTHP
jgi:CheY-like chemotaxis protein